MTNQLQERLNRQPLTQTREYQTALAELRGYCQVATAYYSEFMQQLLIEQPHITRQLPDTYHCSVESLLNFIAVVSVLSEEFRELCEGEIQLIIAQLGLESSGTIFAQMQGGTYVTTARRGP